MQNVYLDPNSYVHVENLVFERSARHNLNNCREPYIFLKDYCEKQGVNLQTIDFWKPQDAKADDIYVAFDHKFLPRKWYWRFKNNKYPILNTNVFAKKILFQFEPPVVMPEIRYLKIPIMKKYNQAFFTWKVKNKAAKYFHTPQANEGVFSDLWQNKDRKLLTIINSNRSSFLGYKELLTERLKAILFFAKTKDIDLYGFGWEGNKVVKNVYRGAAADKYKTLSGYKFAFAYENCELPGYITDKIFDCFLAGTIPIYWGATDIEEYIPKNCFIDMRDFKNYEELREFLKGLTMNDIEKYKENGRQFLESEKFRPFTKEHFAGVFVKAILS